MNNRATTDPAPEPVDAPEINDVTGVESKLNGWTNEELDQIDAAEELQIASRRPDGSLRKYVTIWAVRNNDAIYVRSAYGHDNDWFQRALKSGDGRVRCAGIEKDVDIDVPGDEETENISAAYHEKYDRFGAQMVGTVVSTEAERSTLRLLPR
jgi:hypothetical protein